MSRFPRALLFSLAGAAGLSAMLLIPADDRATGLAIDHDPAAASAPQAATSPPSAEAATPAPVTQPELPVALASTATAPELPVAEPPPAPRTMWVGRSAVNVRIGPSATTARLFVLRPGEKVSASETSGNWTLVVAESGESGWVSARYLSDVAIPAQAAPPKAKQPQAAPEDTRVVRELKFARITDAVTLRSRPSLLSRKLAVLRPGDRIAVLETRGRWVRIVLENGATAWVDGRDL